DDRPDSQHVGLARWAELFFIAPTSANLIAKLAAGFTADPVTLTACALPAATPLLLAPAMNADMWANPMVQRNLQTLRDLLPNLTQVGPDAGWQACRTKGTGRMAEPEALLKAVEDTFSRSS
ncbi:MAG: flavoprotein, partial [Algisphaera sp.]